MQANQCAEAIRIFGANVESKPAPFLQQAQKKCGTHASFNGAEVETGAARKHS
jgi:hypothetical protein